MAGLGIWLSMAYLTFIGKAAEAGQLRIYLAYLALAGILTLNETARSVVRNLVIGDRSGLSRFVLDCVVGLAALRMAAAPPMLPADRAVRA
jgi:hypothetical protein